MILVAVGLSSCLNRKGPDIPVDVPAGKMFAAGKRALAANQFSRAAEIFDLLGRRHPYTTEVQEALLLTASARLRAREFEKAQEDAQRFLQLYPTGNDAAQALFIVGESHRKRISDSSRDQTAARDAIRAFTELARRFPESRYAKWAKWRLDQARTRLAAQEMVVGRYYLDRSDCIAAINRFQNVVREFATTLYVPEALYRLVECHLALGITDEARATAAKLREVAPKSRWAARAGSLFASVAPASSTADAK